MHNFTEENVFTPSDINNHVKHVLEANIPMLLIEGEVANFTHHRSGHMYFSLKDQQASLRCVFFSFNTTHLAFEPADGDKVLAAGKLSVYQKTGQYQLNVQRLHQRGSGLAMLKLEALKAKLASEGLFEQSRKKPMPRYPKNIGVITAANGAAIEDIKNVLARRFPVKVTHYPAAVQGVNAPSELLAGIKWFSANQPDLIIIGRGGGAEEDLAAFNNEDLVRAVADSPVPVISAVGHEIDFCLTDFAADLRAPTPSAAAELAVPDKTELAQMVDDQARRLQRAAAANLQHQNWAWLKLVNRLKQQHPLARLQKRQAVVAHLGKRLSWQGKHLLGQQQAKIGKLQLRLSSALKQVYPGFKQQLQHKQSRLKSAGGNCFNKQNAILQQMQVALQAFSPQAALERGYALVRMQNKLVKSVKQIELDNSLNISLHDGNINCRVEEIYPLEKA